MRTGFVYVGHAHRWGQEVFKFGFSKDPNMRILSISTKQSPVTKITDMPASIYDEMAIHELLSAYRVESEWYRAGTRVHRLIDFMVKNRSIPEPVREVGAQMAALVAAKRGIRASKVSAGDFFRASENFGIVAGKDPFPHSKKVDRNDLSWLIELMNSKNP